MSFVDFLAGVNVLHLMNPLSRRTHLKLVDEVVEDVEDVGGGD